MLGFYRAHNRATVCKPRRSQLKGWMMCLKFRAGLLCGKWLVIGTLLAVALHGNLYAQSFRAAASAGVTSGTTSLTINKPTGTTSGDVMIAAIAVRPNTATITAPSGWTLIRRTDQASGTVNSQAIYRKVDGGGEPASYTWTLGGSPTGAAGGIMTFYGIDTTTPVNVENGQATASALTHATPSVTTTVNNTLLVTAHSFSSSATWTPAGGMTEAVDGSSDAVPNAGGISLEMSYVTQTSAGSTGTKTATASNDADTGVAQILALQGSVPAPVATAATNIQATSFSANWNASSGATGYRLDVATDSGFTSFVTGYNNLNVSNVLTYSVNSNISAGTTYYYRVRAYDGSGTSGNSNTISLTTACSGAGTFQYRKSFTVQAGQVSGGPHTNFPMLINITSDNNLRTVANLGYVASYDAGTGDPRDILFRASDGRTQLDHEIETYDAATGQLVAWVRVPSLNTGTVIYMYYGNSCIASSTQNKTGVWNSNFKGVYHLKETSGGANAIADSTANANHGTDYNSPTLGASGQINGCVDFNGTSHRIDAATSSSLDITGNQITLSAWFRAQNIPGIPQIIFTKPVATGSHNNPYHQYSLHLLNDSPYTPRFWLTIGGTGRSIASSQTVVADTWHLLTGVYDGATMQIYLDGVQRGSVAQTGNISSYNTPLRIGANGAPGEFFKHNIDEVRVANTARSAGWIATEYNNQKSPSTFYSLGDEQNLGYSFRKQITIDYTKVGASCGSGLSNFPVLINISGDADLKTTGNSGHVTSASGYDIIFRSSDDKTKLDHEIEKFDGTSGHGDLVAWVRIPTLSNSANTSIYMYYGNSNISSSQENKNGVWDSNYKGVWHLHNSIYLDSTQYSNNGTNTNTTDNASAKIAGARTFNGTNANVSLGSGTTVDDIFNGGGTISAWIYPTGWGTGTFGRILDKADGNLTDLGWAWQLGNQSGNGNTQSLHIRRDFTSTYGRWNTPTNSISLNAWQHVVLVYDDSSTANNPVMYINGVSQTITKQVNPSGGSWSTDAAQTLLIGDTSGATHRTFAGTIDEARLYKGTLTACWIQTEYNNQNSPSTFYNVGAESAGPTAINLLSFTATGQGAAMGVTWQTAQESDNKGFDLYRGTSPSGPWVKLNSGLIPSGSVSGEGVSYTFIDTGVSRGRLYYYKLEDVDVSGTRTQNGPVCVDWDADGMPDDWEIAHRLNPAVNDANLDPDGDGVPNWLEWQRGTDPFNWDSDGDGIPDGAEKKRPGYSGGSGNVDLGESVQVISSDSTGVTLELLTRSFDTTPVQVGGQAFERLRVPAYVHGFTPEVGRPQLPVKGILLDVPADKTAVLQVLSAERRVLPGYRVYPAPGHRVGDKGQLEEVFVWDEAAYRADALFPAAAAELSTAYVHRGQTKQRLIFHPLRFNPATGELIQTERIRVRVEFYPASGGEKFDSAQGAGNQMAASEGGIHPAAAAAQGWSIPAGAAYKVSTEGEGIYRVTREWLTAQGIGSTEIDAIDLSRLQLFHLGVEQALHVVDANSNNRLDPGDSITLYAAAVPAAYAKYAKYNVYWLIDAGSASPLRMATINGAPAGAPLAVSHPFTVHHELDQGYLQNSPGPDGMDRWLFPAVALGPGFAGGGTAQSFTLTLAGVAGAGELALRLYSPYATDHSASVSLNSVSLGSVTWSGTGFREARFAGVSLLEGANTVAVSCESGEDKIYFDWFEADYARSFAAAADSLKFTHCGRRWLRDQRLQHERCGALRDQRCRRGQAGGQRHYQRQRPLRDRGATRRRRGNSELPGGGCRRAQDASGYPQGYGLKPIRFNERRGLDPDHAPGDRLGRYRGRAELGAEPGRVASGPGAAHGGGGCQRHLR